MFLCLNYLQKNNPNVILILDKKTTNGVSLIMIKNSEMEVKNQTEQKHQLHSILENIRKEALKREEKELPKTQQTHKINFFDNQIHNLIPDSFDLNKRVLPNVFARSALFGIVKYNNKNRIEVKKEKIFSTSQYEIFFTGEMFDQNDLAIWDSIVYLSKNKKITRALHTSLYEICKCIGINNDTRNRLIVLERLKRLSLSKLEINYNKGHHFGSLITKYNFHEDKGILIEINDQILNLFSTKDFTIIDKKILNELGKNQLAKWMFHFYSTHTQPIPFNLKFLKDCSGSRANIREYKRLLKTAMQLIKNSYKKYEQKFDFIITNNELLVSKVYLEQKLLNCSNNKK